MTESRQIALPAYLVSIMLIVMPLADVFTTLYPWRVVDSRWRFGAVGLVSNALLIPIAGLFLAYVTATMLDQRTVRRVVATLSLLAAVVCLVALGLFTLDAVQTRALVAEQVRRSFNVASVAAGIKTLMAMITFAVIGIIGWRGRRRTSEVKDSTVPLFSIETAPVLKPGGPAK